MASFRARTCSFAHGCRIGASGSPISKVGCAPLSKKAELGEACWPSRAGTGPGPDGGGMNGPGVAAQPTEGLGAKSGDASAVRPAPLRHANAPKPIPTVAANLDMVIAPCASGLSAVADDVQPLWI